VDELDVTYSLGTSGKKGDLTLLRSAACRRWGMSGGAGAEKENKNLGMPSVIFGPIQLD
jgi:hypothetical protein